jgi:hypothetical protein
VISDARHSTLARAFQQSGTDKFCSGVLNIPFAVHIRRKIILSRRRQARRPEILCASVLAEISSCSLQLLFGWWSSSEDEPVGESARGHILCGISQSTDTGAGK